jgi:uncharacterized protein
VSARPSLRRYTPVSFLQVSIEDDFWARRIAINHEVSIPQVYQQLKETGGIDAFRLEWREGQPKRPHIFWDSDVAKWLEGACYDLALNPGPERAALVNEVASLIVSAQQPDGYLNTYFTVVEPEKRWTNLRDQHEMYCAGHLLEAAVAHSQTTGERNLLEAMIRYVDYIASVFGREPGQKLGYCGHEEIELALVKLYRLTGEERFLRLSQYFIDARGQQPNYYLQEAQARGETGPGYPLEYLQAHAPVREQADAAGHSVRAMYLYCAMADLAAETGDETLRASCERLWESTTQRRRYVTGGIGSSAEGERFTFDYHLPNDAAYAETCAAIGLVFFAHRMLQLECDARYADVMENALYSGFASGIALEGDHYFYVNPLESRGTHHRQSWFSCACCPTNAVRLLPTLGSYVYSTGPDGIAVHLYVQGEAKLAAAGVPVTVQQETGYPWEGAVRLTVSPAAPTEFALRLRIPGWCHEHTLSVNGATVQPPRERGYAVLRRTWRAGDVITLDLAMPVEKLEAHPESLHDAGKLALQRGPIVYCLEDADHTVNVRRMRLRPEAALTPRFDPYLLGGVTVLEGEAEVDDSARWTDGLYRPLEGGHARPTPLRAIPYCVWDNRTPGNMVVWIPKA